MSGKSTHQDRLDTIRDVEDEYGITIDTHTADGVKVAREHLTPGVPMIVLETALAAKFNETILEALGTDAERPAGFENIEALAAALRRDGGRCRTDEGVHRPTYRPVTTRGLLLLPLAGEGPGMRALAECAESASAAHH